MGLPGVALVAALAEELVRQIDCVTPANPRSQDWKQTPPRDLGRWQLVPQSLGEVLP